MAFSCLFFCPFSSRVVGYLLSCLRTFLFFLLNKIHDDLLSALYDTAFFFTVYNLHFDFFTEFDLEEFLNIMWSYLSIISFYNFCSSL